MCETEEATSDTNKKDLEIKWQSNMQKCYSQDIQSESTLIISKIIIDW